MAEITEAEAISRVLERLKEARSSMQWLGQLRHDPKWIKFAEITDKLRDTTIEHAYAKVGLIRGDLDPRN